MKIDFGLVACAVAAAFIPSGSPAVERWYASGLFPRLQPLLTSVSNLSGIAFLDVLILAGVLVVAIAVIRGVVSRQREAGTAPAVLHAASRVLAVVACFYLVFLAAWGLNYRRVPLIQRIPFDATQLSVDRVRALAEEAAAQLNALYGRAHAGQPPPPYATDQELARAFHDASGRLGIVPPVIVARPKRTLLDPYFRRAAIAGMTDPYFLEALIASDLLAVERPFVIAHEWSHIAGLADEGEANFAGWLTCLHGTPAHQYSGWLFAYTELSATLDDRSRRALAARLRSGPRADLLAIRDRIERQVNPRVSAAGWRVYDRYLKANRVAAGAASYSEVVRLMLGVAIDTAPPSSRAPADQPTDRTAMAAASGAGRGSPR